MNPPPNPNAAQARAEMMAHNALVQNPQHDDAPPAPTLSAGLERIVTQWPDMAKYYKTARIDKLYHKQGWCWCVTVTIKECEK